MPLTWRSLEVAYEAMGHAPVGIAICDRDLVVRYVNPHGLQLLGTEAAGLVDQPVGQVLSRLLRDEIAAQVLMQFEQVRDRGTTMRSSGWWHPRHGHDRARCLQWDVRRILTATASPSLIVTAIDISEHEQLRTQLAYAHEQEYLLRQSLLAAQRAGGVGTFALDVRTNHLTSSPELDLLHGVAPDTLTGPYDKWASRIVPEDLTRVHAAIEHAQQQRTPYDAEFRFRRPDGTVRWMHSKGRFVYDEQGKPLRLIGVTIDIQEHKEIELALKRANHELESFAYIASHDLQEPLRMVSSYLALIQRRFGSLLPPQAHEYMQFAIDGAQRMSALISNLLEFARLDRQQVHLVPLDSGHILDDAIRELGVRIRETGAEVTRTGPFPTVFADRQQLQRLFRNILSNGIKYVPKGRHPQLIVSAAHVGDTWQFHFRDNGIGIAEADRERIFALFQRLHPQDDYPGTGLGLAICRRIVESHRGRIWVESVLNEGSTFCVALPDYPPGQTPGHLRRVDAGATAAVPHAPP